MNTNDCKNFINSISEQYLLFKNDKWKRVRKYKENEVVLREFKSTSGDSLVMSESNESVLGIYSLELLTTALSSTAINYLTQKKLFEELNKFSKDDFESSQQIEITNPKNALTCSYEFIQKLIQETLITNITFDLENIEIYYHSKEDISYLELEAGGDWEYPITAFFYWSETDNSIKGFFPLGEGNTYNIETNTAYGSEDSDDDELTERYEDKMNELNGDSADMIGFRQFKQHIERKYKNL